MGKKVIVKKRLKVRVSSAFLKKHAVKKEGLKKKNDVLVPSKDLKKNINALKKKKKRIVVKKKPKSLPDDTKKKTKMKIIVKKKKSPIKVLKKPKALPDDTKK